MDPVIVVGAGPTGLWLAAELRLHDVPVIVLEARVERDEHSKAITVHPRTLEILAMRGIAGRFVSAGMPIPVGHFAGLPDRMDFGVLDGPYPYTLFLPQARTEELLEEHAVALGATVLRGHRVTGLEQRTDAVTVRVTGPSGAYDVRASYVAGCDGTRSTVREAAGIAFPGTEATAWGWLGDVVLDDPPAGPLSASGPDGLAMVVPLPGGAHRFVGLNPEDLRPEHPGELRLERLREKVRRVLGTDHGMRDPRWLSRFGNAARQAAAYRAGRVVLAGDAAHMHFPAGGVGLNVGLQDAANLGWKLAATIRDAHGDLLDTYHAERHPVGARLLAHTQAQTALMAGFSADGQALRAVFSALIAEVPELSRALAGRLSALDVRYDVPDAHPLAGTRAPDLAFTGGTGLFALMHAGRHVLLDLSGGHPEIPGADRHGLRLAEPVAGWEDVSAALVRPDGHIAWAR
ncbi:2-polyprenyl-6-methoxyphenol hydroxylase [Nonomuraea solani]|uniref:2-polyprenyl-6-methoxyphenol hydroxylase n=1 Tax=Nonomuraea solani TaxID=1144553 RepID=A0A1H6E3E0_9ACTN|nr:FAD-dependent monooxygenase [Nonomuraea solani]SEG91614.1 2-polyprenyl-6-methoxyphenol hydroxylase [Nonomuraea solani]